MRSPKHLRVRARDCLNIAKSAGTQVDKTILEDMAVEMNATAAAIEGEMRRKLSTARYPRNSDTVRGRSFATGNNPRKSDFHALVIDSTGALPCRRLRSSITRAEAMRSAIAREPQKAPTRKPSMASWPTYITKRRTAPQT